MTLLGRNAIASRLRAAAHKASIPGTSLSKKISALLKSKGGIVVDPRLTHAILAVLIVKLLRSKIGKKMVRLLVAMTVTYLKILKVLFGHSVYMFATLFRLPDRNVGDIVLNGVGPPNHRGYFKWGYQSYFRESPICVYEVEVVEIQHTMPQDGEGPGTDVLRAVPKNKLMPVNLYATSPSGFGESALHTHPRNAQAASLGKGEVQLYHPGDGSTFCSGVVVKFDGVSWLVFTKHNTADLTNIVVKGTNGANTNYQKGVVKDMSEALCLHDLPGKPKWNSKTMECTMWDMLVLKLAPDEVSAIGVKALQAKDFEFQYENRRASIRYHAGDFNDLIEESGHIPATTPSLHNLGVAYAVINSDYGASGSGVKFVEDGTTKVGGMWLGKPRDKTEHGKANCFMTADCMFAIFKELGIYTCSLEEKIRQTYEACPFLGESRETKKQRRRRLWQELQAAYDQEQLRVAEEEAEAELWEQEDRPGVVDVKSNRFHGPVGHGKAMHNKSTVRSPPGLGTKCESCLGMLPDARFSANALLLKRYHDQNPRVPRVSMCTCVTCWKDQRKLIKLVKGAEPGNPKCTHNWTNSEESPYLLSLRVKNLYEDGDPRVNFNNVVEAMKTANAGAPGLPSSDGSVVWRSLGHGKPSMQAIAAAQAAQLKSSSLGESARADRAVRAELKFPGPSELPVEELDVLIEESLSKLPPAVQLPIPHSPMPVDDYAKIGESLSMPSWKSKAPEPSLGESAGDNLKYFNWKRAVKDGKVDQVLEEAEALWTATPNVRERLELALSSATNEEYRDYLSKVVPQIFLEEKDREVLLGKDEVPFFKKVAMFEGKEGKPKAKKKVSNETALQLLIRNLATKYHDEGSHGCDKGRHEIPEDTKENLLKSLRAQSGMANAGAPKLNGAQQKDFDAAVELARSKYQEPLGGKKIKTYLEEGEYGLLKTFQGLEDKSSGVSQRYMRLKKKTWCEKHTKQVVDFTLSRLVLMIVAGPDLADLDPLEQVRYGIADCKEMFLKNEKHSPKKLKEERFRMIWISSLIDLVLQSLLHKADNAFYTDAYQEGYISCAAVGMGHDPDGIKHLIKAFRREGLELNISSDATAFDLSFPGICVHADADRRADNVESPRVAGLVRWYGHVLCSHVLCVGNDVWVCLKHGCTSTGQLSTTTQNTFGRAVSAAYGGAKSWVNTGDDLVASRGFDYKKLEDLGISSRNPRDNEHEADFTSHMIDFNTGKARFCNVEKMLWTLYEHCTDLATNKERFGGNLYVLRDTPGVYDDLLAIARDQGIDVSATQCDVNTVLEYM